MNDHEYCYDGADAAHIKREKGKAKKLRESQWWKNRRSSGICHYCQTRFPPIELTMDHIVPIARGGFSQKSNIVPACKTCNTAKKNRVPLEWQGLLEP